VIRTIAKDFRILSSLTILLSGILIGGTWAIIDYVSLKQESQTMHNRLLSNREIQLKERAQHAVNYINFFREQTEERLKTNIKSRTYEACEIAAELIKKHQGTIQPDTLHHIIRDSLRKIRYNNGRGYFFAINVNGTEELFADKPHLEGKDLTGMQDSNGQFVIKDMLALASKSGEGFYRYTWSKPGNDRKDNIKVAFVKHLPELDWVIGTGEYMEDVKQDLQQEVIDSLDAVYRDPDGTNYLFVGTWDGLILSRPAKGKNMLEIQDTNGLFIVRELIKQAKSGGGFVQYVMPRFEGERPAPKLSYVAGISEWQWFIGAGEYTDYIDSAVLALRDNYFKNLQAHFFYILSITLGVLLLNLLIINIFANKLRIQIKRFVDFFLQAKNQSVTIDIASLTHSEFRSIGSAANIMLQERNAALSALKTSEDRFRALHEASFGGVIIHDKGLILDCNQGLSDMTGYTNKELIGMDGLHLVSPDSLDQVLHNIKTGYTKRYEVKGLRKDGSVYPLSIKGKNVVYQGRDVRVIEFQDISPYKQAVHELRESEERFRQIFEANPDPVILAKLEGGAIIDVNKSFVSLTGISRLEALGHNSLELRLWADEEMREPFLAQLRRDGELNNFEADFRVMDGQLGTGLLSARIVRINNEPSVLIVIRDITTEKAAERTMIKMNRMKSEFISTAAHELNTPLSAIMGYTEFLTDPDEFGGFSEEQKQDFLNEIYGRGEALKRIIEDLLDIGRIEGGHQVTLDLQETELVEVLRKSVDFFRVNDKGHTFRLELPDQPSKTTLFIDRHRVTQVLENLLSNAVKYSPKGKEIVLKGQEDLEGWRISVEDLGIGMNQEQIDRIFDKFYRANASDTAISGLGLGMSIARQIVEAHDGNIQVESTEGEGTTVTFYLPHTVT